MAPVSCENILRVCSAMFLLVAALVLSEGYFSGIVLGTADVVKPITPQSSRNFAAAQHAPTSYVCSSDEIATQLAVLKPSYSACPGNDVWSPLAMVRFVQGTC